VTVRLRQAVVAGNARAAQPDACSTTSIVPRDLTSLYLNVDFTLAADVPPLLYSDTQCTIWLFTTSPEKAEEQAITFASQLPVEDNAAFAVHGLFVISLLASRRFENIYPTTY
jgi:hypothetical protein